MKAKEAFIVSSKPHWRARTSSKSIAWQFLAALLPIWALGLLKNFPAAFSLVVLSVSFGMFFRFLSSVVSKRKKWLDESTIYSCVLFAGLVPFGLPLSTLAVGIFFVVVMAEECFGGRGQNIFNPALIGFIAVSLLFSDQLAFCYESFGSILLWANPPKWVLILEIIFIVLGGLFLSFRKIIAWQLPLFYLVPVFITMIFFQHAVTAKLPMVPVLFSALFLVTDYASSPISARGRVIFASGCGLFLIVFNEWLPGFDAIACSILLMNSISPLIDRYVKTRLAVSQ